VAKAYGGGVAAFAVQTTQGLPGFLASRVDAQCLYKAETGVIWGRSASTARIHDGGLSSPPSGAEQGTNGG
jgi:hypothetical protein